jgi:hypothetical protein
MVVEVNGTAKLAEATTVRVGVGAALPGGVSLKLQYVMKYWSYSYTDHPKV